MPLLPPIEPDAMAIAPTTAQLRATHQREASRLQHAVDRLTALVGGPYFVTLLSLTIATWVTANVASAKLGFAPVDPQPFPGLQGVIAVGALILVALILTTQRHEDQLADQRTQLLLELSIANDQKIAKIIELLEESRRDNPAITDRVDTQAAAMATPSDTVAVLDAIKDIRDDLV